MKVLFVMENSIPIEHGCAVRNRYLMENLMRMGLDVVGLTSPFMEIRSGEITKGSEIINGIRYHRSQYLNSIKNVSSPILRWAKRIPMFLKYCELLKSICLHEKPNIIHAITSYVNGNAANRIGVEMNIPRLYEVRSIAGSVAAIMDGKSYSSFKYQTVWKLDRKAMLEATRVAPLSQVLKNELIRRGLPENKMDVVHNAIDIDIFTRQERSVEVENRYGLRDNIVIGFIGSISNIEGLSLIVKAAPHIIRQCPNAKFLIVGNGENLKNLEEQASQEGVANFFTFTGRVSHSEILKYYSVIDIFTIPRIDALVNQTVAPLKPLEAMATEKAVLASDVSGLAEAIKDGKTGVLFKTDDLSDFTEKLVELIWDKEKRSAIGKAAREWIITNRQWNSTIQQYLTIYNKLLSKDWSRYHK